MKTEAQLARTELELSAVDSTFGTLRYLDYNPRTDSWTKYLKALEDTLSRELRTREAHIGNY